MALTKVSRGLLSTGIVDNSTTTAITIDSSENVGIGTGSPDQSLVVNGQIGLSYDGTNSYQGLKRSGVGTVYYTGTTSTATDAIHTFTGSSDAVKMTILEGGNVGIGTSSPSTALEVSGAVTVTRSDVSNDNSTISNEGGLFTISAATGGGGGTYPMLFKTAAVERMRIDASGQLIVGGTSPVQPSKVGIQGGSSVNRLMTYEVTHTTDFGPVGFHNGNGLCGSISMYTNNTVSFNTSSDQRLKENIADADDAGSKVDSIQVRKFDWKADGSHQDYGMIAQELQAVAPEAVSPALNPEEMMGVDYSKLVPMLVKEIQSLRSRVAQLENN